MRVKIAKMICCTGRINVRRQSHGIFTINAPMVATRGQSFVTIELNKIQAHDVTVTLLEFFPDVKAHIRKKVRDAIKRRTLRRKAKAEEK